MTRPALLLLLPLLITAAGPPAGAQPGGERARGEKEEDIRERDRFRRQQRLDAGGRLEMGALVRAREELDQIIRAQSAAPAPMNRAGLSWEWLGPGNVGGRIRTILIHPANPNLMWVGSVSGGIWRTTDAGGWWYPVDDFMANLAVTSMVMDPANPSVIYAATGEGFGNQDALPGAGIFKSVNGGANWNQLASTNDTNFTWVNRLAHHPAASGILLAATGTGLYRTTNGGGSWTRILLPDSLEQVTDVEYHPANPARILVGTSKDLYYSTAGGSSWQRLTAGDPGKLPVSPGRCEVAFAPSDPNRMYASVAQGFGRLWWTTDGGSAWEETSVDLGQGWYANAIWVNPFDADFLILGSVDLYRVTDGGAGGGMSVFSDWQVVYTGSPETSAHADHHAIVPHPGFNNTTNRTVYVATDGGIYRQNDVQTQGYHSGWTNLNNGLGITQFYGGSASRTGSLIVGGAQDNDKIHYRPAGGINGWEQPELGDGGYAAVDYVDPWRVYGEYVHLRILRSDDGGHQYFQRTTGLLDADSKQRTLFIAPFVIDPNDPNVLVAGGTTIWKTANNANTWSAIRAPVSPAPNPRCSAIDVARGNSAVIWVGYETGLVSYTTNGGTGWINAGSPGGGRMVTDIAINPFAPDEVFVTVGGYTNDNVWFTTNSGSTWTQRTGTGINRTPAVQANTVRFHPLDPASVYLGTDLGMFASTDKGLNWYTAGLPSNVEVAELFWQGSTVLVAATYGRGMYRSQPFPVTFVDKFHSGPEDGSELLPFTTVQEAAAAYPAGATISIAPGEYDEPAVFFTKPGVLRARGGTVVIK